MQLMHRDHTSHIILTLSSNVRVSPAPRHADIQERLSVPTGRRRSAGGIPWILTPESFQLHMGILFPFLRAKDLRTSLLIIRTLIFLTLLYVGGKYARGKRGGQRPPPYVLTPRQLSEGRGFSNQIFFCWTSLYVASGTKCRHVTKPIT